MAYWIKIIYDKNTYVIDLEQIGVFSSAPNGKLTFWLPNNKNPIILNPLNNPDSYQQVRDYIQKVTSQALGHYWIKFNYDREEFLIDLYRISAFSKAQNGKITFWLPDSGTPMIIHPNNNAEVYQQIMDYIQKTTGYTDF